MGRIRVVLDGPGEMELGVNADALFVDHENAGHIALNGVADKLVVNLAGSGDIASFSMPVPNAVINVAASGSGTVEVEAMDSLHVDILGPGRVLYRGDPVISQRITGTGTLSSVN